MLRHSVRQFPNSRGIVLYGGTQRRAVPRHQSEEMKILNILSPRVGIEPFTWRVYSHALVPERYVWRRLKFY